LDSGGGTDLTLTARSLVLLHFGCEVFDLVFDALCVLSFLLFELSHFPLELVLLVLEVLLLLEDLHHTSLNFSQI